jgi:hypothetical protein
MSGAHEASISRAEHEDDADGADLNSAEHDEHRGGQQYRVDCHQQRGKKPERKRATADSG